MSGFIATAAHSQAIIDNGTVALGVNPQGNLIVSGGSNYQGLTGLTYIPSDPASEALAPGCWCEGWGIADLGTSFWGQAGAEFGYDHLSGVELVVSGVGSYADSTGSAAVSDVDVSVEDWAVHVTHDFAPSVSPNLYRVDVTITNTGTDSIAQLVYRRAMDWDIPPTEFDEYVTIQGLPAANLIFSSDNGFADGDPNSYPDAMNSETINVNFTDNGPDDHGAVFDFDFGALANGESVSFTIFYGAAGNEADALAALAAVGAEVYSLGQPGTEDGATLGTPNTFIFAFAGVGGTSLGGDPHGFLNTFRDIATLIMRSHRRVTGQFTTVDPGSRIAVEQVAAMSQNAKVVDNGLDSLRVYGVINADFGNFDAYGSNAGFTYDSTGMLLGADYQLPSTSMGGADVVVGGSIGFQSIASSIKGSPSGVDADAVVGSLYAYGAKRVGGAGQLHGEARGMFSYLWYDDTRVAGNATHSGSPDGYGLGVDVEVGYQLDKIHPGGNQDFGVQVGPFVGLGYGYSKVDAYQESNGGLAVSSFDDDSLNATVGGRVSLTHETAENTYFAMLQASYTRDFLADGQQVALEDGALFSQLSAPDENLYGLRLVGGMNWGSSIRAMVEYNGALSEHSTQHSLMGRLDFAF